MRANDKQRFSLACINDKMYIRANQGHSVDGIDQEKLLERIQIREGGDVIFAIHGTYKGMERYRENGWLAQDGQTARSYGR